MKGKNRFDGKSVRRILEHAAAEQHRLDIELGDSYSLEELEEIAAEVGISPEALHVAIESPRAYPGSASARTAVDVDERSRDWLALLRKPGNWPSAVKATVVTTAVGIVLLGALLAFPQLLFWVTIVLLVLILLGAFSF